MNYYIFFIVSCLVLKIICNLFIEVPEFMLDISIDHMGSLAKQCVN
jgi:hypothetical protein